MQGNAVRDNLGIKTADLERLRLRETIALTGAGISADSGMPTFRGKNGLWEKHRPEELANPSAFLKNPELVWAWYSWRLEKLFSVEPSPAHHALAKLESLKLLKLLITQNVDDLHERAGSKRILKLHGSIVMTQCISCGHKGQITEPPRKVPLCACSGMLRPAVVWFGESLNPRILKDAFWQASNCSCMLVIGTSGIVYPAAALPQIAKQNGALILEFNISSTALTPLADYHFSGAASNTVPRFFSILINDSVLS